MPISPPPRHHDLRQDTLRPPSSQYATPIAAQFGESHSTAASSPAGSNPFRNRDSDAISEMSVRTNLRLQRSKSGRRDADEVSIVSALSPQDIDNRNFDYLH
jgi:hypothetical protein